jgi:peptide/nickel transport system ATP-binding protein
VTAPLLTVENLRVAARSARGERDIVRGVSFAVDRGETLAIVGESGSGKTMTMLATTGLFDPAALSVTGSALLGELPLLGAQTGPLRHQRGKRIGMIFQEPSASLDPVLTVGQQMSEKLRLYYRLPRRAARERAADLLAQVGIGNPRERLDAYPHELSGGMCQRVMIALAISCEPELLIADEPTTALDVTTQARIVELVQSIQAQMGLALIWVSHDLALVSRLADRIQVMYGGSIVETGRAGDVLRRPNHPYTRGLLGAIPSVTMPLDRDLLAIPGRPPEPGPLPHGCVFYDRCQYRADPRCERLAPPLRDLGDGHRSATFCDLPPMAALEEHA